MKKNKDIDGLKNIYADENGKIPDLSKIERGKRGKKKIFFSFFIALLLVAAGAWYFFWPSSGLSPEGSADLGVITPATAIAGNKINYSISYKNKDRVDLKNLELTVDFPEGFVFLSSSPELKPALGDNTAAETAAPQKTFVFDFPDLGAGKTGKVEITGELMGELNSKKTFSANLAYWPANFHSQFEINATGETVITSTALDLTLTGPAEAAPLDPLFYKIGYKNSGLDDLGKIKITLFSDTNFTLKAKNPDTTSQEKIPGDGLATVWNLDQLKANDTGEITIDGQPQEIKTKNQIKVRAEMLARDNNFYTLAEQTIATSLVGRDLAASLLVNGSPEDAGAKLGDTLEFTLNLKNQRPTDLNDVQASVVLEASAAKRKSIIDWNTLLDANNGQVVGKQISDTIRQGIISWNKGQLPALAKISPSGEITISFKINLKNLSDLNITDYKDLQIKSWAEIKSGAENFKSNVIQVTVNPS